MSRNVKFGMQVDYEYTYTFSLFKILFVSQQVQNIWQVEGKRLYVTIRCNIDKSDIDLPYKTFLKEI
jgi:hypothetical protein